MGNAAYDAAKAAVIGMTRTLSRSLGPSASASTWWRPVQFTRSECEMSSARNSSTCSARIPLRRMPGPGDVAALLEFLFMPTIGPDQRGGDEGRWRTAIAKSGLQIQKQQSYREGSHARSIYARPVGAGGRRSLERADARSGHRQDRRGAEPERSGGRVRHSRARRHPGG